MSQTVADIAVQDRLMNHPFDGYSANGVAVLSDSCLDGFMGWLDPLKESTPDRESYAVHWTKPAVAVGVR